MHACIERGTAAVREPLEAVARYTKRLRELQDTLDPSTGTSAERHQRFGALATALGGEKDPVLQHIARTMTSFSPGLFAGGDDLDLPSDNLDLERAFRVPKGHERRIHGHAHAGVRIVHRGPSLLLVLDAHTRHPEPFSAEELAPWVNAPVPPSQQECRRRRGIMRQARSREKRPVLLADLERRYRDAIQDS